MKFSTTASFLALGLSLGVAAEPTRVQVREPSVVERDLATVTGVLSDISTKVDALDSAINSFSGDFASLKSASDAVISSITDGTSKISGSDMLSSNDALQLPNIVQDLQKKIETSVTDVTSKKSAIVSAGFGGTTLKSLQDQKTAAGKLSDAITAKVPESLQSIASQLSSGISAAIQKGIDAYQGSVDTSPTSGGSASQTSAGGASTTAAAGTSSTPAGGSSSPSSSSAAHSSSRSPTPTAGSSSSASSPVFTGAAALNTYGGSVGVMAIIAAAIAV